ncbi:glycosyltransferase family 4 protein [Haloferax larsenii]|uniref:Glycosyltransferase involved in cell wall bisynthesis n=1 Tax=Haloferax larsenii TaxID=302484 RepID=A0A1H7PSE2_HALLR|nr:glycosyltransferase family 4 protein [Haloferax larsenii]SEL38683.1 Glycosyltransferase involved in cell wall bisynthesis [Haloferax larsenii]
MHVVQVNHLHRPSLGGLENYSHRLAESLRAGGHAVDVVTTDMSLANDRSPLGPESGVTYCKTTATVMRNPLSLELFRVVRQHDADVYHLHSPWYLSSLAATLALPKDAPTVMTIHGFQPLGGLVAKAVEFAYHPFAQFIFDRMDRIIVLGAAEKRRLLREYRVPEEKVVVIPNGIHPDEHDVPESAVEAFRDTHGIDPSRPTILFVGRLVELKNPDVLVDTVVDELADLDVNVVVVGHGEESFVADLQARADDRFHFLSNLPFEELQAAYHASDVFVSLSRSEGLPTVVLEAMNARLPVVTTPAGALEDVIQDGVHGAVLDIPPSRAQLATALRRYVEDEALRTTVGERNRAYVRDQFDWDVVAADIVSLYEAVLDDGHRPPVEDRQPTLEHVEDATHGDAPLSDGGVDVSSNRSD